MAGLDDVLERLVSDPSFRLRLAANPAAALAGYDLSDEDRALLASQVTDVAGAGGGVEARTSRASMAGLLGALGELAVASAVLATFGELDASPGVDHDVLRGGAGGGDPIPAAPSGSGYNELSLQDTSGRETFDPTFGDVLISPVQVGGSADGGPVPDLAAPVEAIADADRVEPPAHGADALVWDPGDGSDVAAKGEHIVIESWSPGTPAPSAAPDVPDEQVAFAYAAIKFTYDAPAVDSLAEPDTSDPEPTGPIADVLYSAGGGSTGDSSGDPGSPGTGFYRSLDSGATWVEGAAASAETSFDYPGTYAERFDGVDKSSPGDGLDLLIAGQTVYESQDTVPDDPAIAIGDDADRAAGRGGGIINDAGSITLVSSTLTESGDGADATGRSLADPAPAATDGWVNVGQTEQYLFDNADIAEPEIDGVAPATGSQPSGSSAGDPTS